jgi:hypothetical protein
LEGALDARCCSQVAGLAQRLLNKALPSSGAWLRLRASRSTATAGATCR